METNSSVSRYNADIFKMRLKEVSGKNQTQVAKDLDMSKDNLNKKISGETGKGHLSVFDLMQIAEKYDCSIDYLLGLSDRMAITSSDEVLLSDVIKVFDALFEKGVFSMDSDSVKFSNDVFNYFYAELKRIRQLKDTGTITDNDYKNLLKGLVSDFAGYSFMDSSTVAQIEKECKELSGKDFHLLNFTEWKEKESDMFKYWDDISDRQLYKCYVEDTYFFRDSIKNLNDKDLDGLLKTCLKYSGSRNGFKKALLDDGFTDEQAEMELKELSDSLNEK